MISSCLRRRFHPRLPGFLMSTAAGQQRTECRELLEATDQEDRRGDGDRGRGYSQSGCPLVAA